MQAKLKAIEKEKMEAEEVVFKRQEAEYITKKLEELQKEKKS